MYCLFHLYKLKQRKFDFNLTTLNKCFPSEVFKAGRRWNSGAQREETADNFIWNFCFYGKPRVVSILQLCVVFTDVTHNFFKLISKLSKHVTKCICFKVLDACNFYCTLTWVYWSEKISFIFMNLYFRIIMIKNKFNTTHEINKRFFSGVCSTLFKPQHFKTTYFSRLHVKIPPL